MHAASVKVKSGFSSGVYGVLLLVVDGLRCERCNGMVQQSD